MQTVNGITTKKLIIHVGYSKCGSTTIQDTLTAHYSSLLEERILFPKALSESHSWLRFFWEENLPVTYGKDVSARLERFTASLREELRASSCDTVILSDVGLISLSEGSLNQFRRYLEQEFSEFEIHVVILVREPISFFTSRSQQFISDRYFDFTAVKQFLAGEVITNGELRADCFAMNPISFFSKPIQLYDENFGNVHLLEFEELIRSRLGFTNAFLSSCGLDFQFAD